MATPAPGGFDSERALEHVRVLSVDIGSRPAGSDAEDEAAEYIRSQLASYGYQASLQDVPFETFRDEGEGLTVISPDSRNIFVIPLSGTPNGVVEAPLAAAGLGRVEEIPADAAGKVLLVERGELTFSMKANNAVAAGAAALVIYNNEAGPFAGELTDFTPIPVGGISRDDGRALLEVLDAGPVNVRLHIDIKPVTENSQNVVAEPSDGTCEVVVGGHYDSVPQGPGANDNASGTAVVLELARARAAAGEEDGVCYVLFGAEEIGLLGSFEYVNGLSGLELEALDAMLNFDMLGVGERWPLTGSRAITDIAGPQAAALGLNYSVASDLPEQLGSDHQPFIIAGVPSIIFNCFCDPRYHSAEDSFEHVREERLAEAGALALGILEQLLTAA